MTVLFVNVSIDPGHCPKEFSQQQKDFPFFEHEVFRMEIYSYSQFVMSQDFAFRMLILKVDYHFKIFYFCVYLNKLSKISIHLEVLAKVWPHPKKIKTCDIYKLCVVCACTHTLLIVYTLLGTLFNPLTHEIFLTKSQVENVLS